MLEGYVLACSGRRAAWTDPLLEHYPMGPISALACVSRRLVSSGCPRRLAQVRPARGRSAARATAGQERLRMMRRGCSREGSRLWPAKCASRDLVPCRSHLHHVLAASRRDQGLVVLRYPARDHLTGRQGCRTQQVRATYHHHFGERPRLRFRRFLQRADRRYQYVFQLFHGGDVHHGGGSVVRRLAVVDVIVRTNWLLRPHGPTGELDRAIGDHLVGVHVGLCVRGRLETRPAETPLPTCRRSPPARAIRSTFWCGNWPNSSLAMAAHLLRMLSARITGRPQRGRSAPMGKFSCDRCVCVPKMPGRDLDISQRLWDSCNA